MDDGESARACPWSVSIAVVSRATRKKVIFGTSRVRRGLGTKNAPCPTLVEQKRRELDANVRVIDGKAEVGIEPGAIVIDAQATPVETRSN
jgi:hypothetical protein